jgi:hypothetical protein
MPELAVHSAFQAIYRGGISFAEHQRTQWLFPKKTNNKQTSKQHHNVFICGQKTL